jgi:hypothetical protein
MATALLWMVIPRVSKLLRCFRDQLKLSLHSGKRFIGGPASGIISIMKSYQHHTRNASYVGQANKCDIVPQKDVKQLSGRVKT